MTAKEKELYQSKTVLNIVDKQLQSSRIPTMMRTYLDSANTHENTDKNQEEKQS